jgi:hypothetical protein
MPTFKYKTNKKITVDDKSITTLDNRHKEMQLHFLHVKKVIIPNLLKEKKELTNLLNSNSNNINNNNSNIFKGDNHDDRNNCNKEEENGSDGNITIPIEKQLEIKDRISDIKSTLKAHKNNIKQYYLSNSKYIFDYFENKKEISNGNTKTKILNSFFKLDGENNRVNELTSLNDNNVKKFLSNIDESFINVNDFMFQTDICKYCNIGELIPVEHEGILVCNHCSKYVMYLFESEKPSYKEPPKEACFYAYKRINHFKEILAQFQAKETTQIPAEVIDNIKLQIKKERISLSKFTNTKAKDILKKLGYNKFYEHIPYIKDKLGIKPPIMTQQLEEQLCNLFMEIQGPYAKYCPDDRVNFLNYYYTIYKLCELLGQTQFLCYFPLLKDREKQIEQDEIWKKICADLNWEFIPTQ